MQVNSSDLHTRELVEELKEVLSKSFSPGFCTRELHLRAAMATQGPEPLEAGGDLLAGPPARLAPLTLDPPPQPNAAAPLPSAAAAAAVPDGQASSDGAAARLPGRRGGAGASTSSSSSPVPAKHPFEGLNDEQRAAVQSVVDGTPVMLTLGPPGTGKTTVRAAQLSSRGSPSSCARAA